MKRLIIGMAVLAGLALVGFYLLTWPRHITAAELPKHSPNPENGRYMFYAGGCASCHARPSGGRCDNPKYDTPKDLSGGRCLKTPFGVFYAPNITPDKATGIGGWSMAEFVTAMKNGVAPDGRYYYPAFPYTSYGKMKITDLMDLKAYLDTLPAVQAKSKDHELPLPFRLRRGIGLWQLLFLDNEEFKPDPAVSAQINRGAYLVNGPGHCGECHTPRNIFGAMIKDKAFSGAPNPEGKGIVPNITPHASGLKSWSVQDIAYALKTGFTPSFDSFGGSMVQVQENMAKLSDEDRLAIAAYLKSLPPRPSSVGPKNN